MPTKKVKRVSGRGIAQRVQMVLDRLDRLAKVDRVTPDQLEKIKETLELALHGTLVKLELAAHPEERTKFSFQEDRDLDAIEKGE